MGAAEQELLNQAINGNLEELWKLFTMEYDQDRKGLMEDYQRIRYGKEGGIQFDIYYYIEYTKDPQSKYFIYVNPKEKTVVIDGNKYSLKDFWTELEEREAYTRNILIELLDTDESPLVT